MAYIDVLPLAEAKEYLRIDTNVAEDDAFITDLIEASLQYIEETTNVRVVQQATRKYAIDSSRTVRVYDTPINAVPTLTVDEDYTRTDKANYTLFEIWDGDLDELTVDVGYAVASNVPTWVKPIALAIIQHWYNDIEEDRGEYIPKRVEGALRRHKRFIL